MTIASHTLGCKLNYAETNHLIRQFSLAGYQVVDFSEKADIYVINTCTVTSVAEKKCRTIIHQAHRSNPDALIAVIGCFATNAPDSVSQIPGVSLVLGNDEKHRLFDRISTLICNGLSNSCYKPGSKLIVEDSTHPKGLKTKTEDLEPPFPIAFSLGDRTRSFLKVQDGCDYFCTYCAIPFARGRSRCASVAQAVEAARQIAAAGIKEVVLTGVNTGTFGLHSGESFLQLIQALDQVEGIERYRISSIEPNLISDDIIRFVASSRAFLPHFHIPLQAGSDKLLSLMHRHYDTALYLDKLLLIKSFMPDACIAADIMAGFNGEDEMTFQDVCRYVESLPISYLHVFTYSDRPNTAALRLGEKIPMSVRHQHSQLLHEISDRKKDIFYQSQMGRHRPVLWESSIHDSSDLSRPMMQGWTDNYIRVQQPFDPSLVGHITSATISPSTVVHNFVPDE